MEYRRMIESARKSGVADESKMWKSISAIDDLLEDIEEETRDRFMRKMHEVMYGCHYDEEFARKELEHLSYIDRNGMKAHGAHWSLAEIENATRGLTFGSSVTKYDKLVAYAIGYSDWCRVLNDDEILKATHAFFFADEDWSNKDAKIWQYMSAKEWYESR